MATLLYEMQIYFILCRESVDMQTVAIEPDANEPSDRVLLAEFTDRKSTKAFADLMKRHAGLVLSTCQRGLGCGSESEDAAQAVFILMWQHAKKLSRHSSVAGWLHTTACNVCRNSRRTSGLRLKHEREAAKMSTKSFDSSAAVWLELREILDGEIELLPAKLRTPLVLFHLEGRGLKEIADELNVSVSTVGTWMVVV